MSRADRRTRGSIGRGQAERQPKLDAATAARRSSRRRPKARASSRRSGRKAARDLEPMSVFISRKTQRLYVRQDLQPILDIPVTIQDADRPIGTHIFTAMERIGTDIDGAWYR